MSVTPAGLQGIATPSVANMDLDTAMASIQGERTRLLEGQLRAQLTSVGDRNQNIAAMGDQLAAKRAELGKLEGTGSSEARVTELTAMRDQLTAVKDRDASGWTGMSYGWGGDDKTKSNDMLTRVKAEGLTNIGEAPRDIDGNGTMDVHAKTAQGWIDQLNTKISDAKAAQQQIPTLKTEIENLKTGIDAQSNSQQMDMLRLQSLSNKRNEAFDVMTNFVKKMQDSRSSILGNMR